MEFLYISNGWCACSQQDLQKWVFQGEIKVFRLSDLQQTWFLMQVQNISLSLAVICLTAALTLARFEPLTIAITRAQQMKETRFISNFQIFTE